MIPAKPYTACANGCGVPAKWKVTKNNRPKNLCNGCATKTKPRPVKAEKTRTDAERSRRREVLDRLVR